MFGEEHMPQLPPPSEPLVVLAVALRNLERRMPGLMDDVLADLETECLRSEIVRLRGPKVAAEMKGVLTRATFWTASVRIVAMAIPPISAKKKRRA
jgi:hypothetical protein